MFTRNRSVQARRIRHLSFSVAVPCALLMGCAAVPAPEAVDPSQAAWRTLAVADVDALYTSVRDLHPGYRDPETPDFEERVSAAYRKAQVEANEAKTYLDWRSATVGFMQSFRDGHAIYRVNAAPSVVRWPGFLIDVQGGHYVVRTPTGLTHVDQSVPAGTRILSCDGQEIGALLEERLDGREADWSKPPERIRQAYKLLIDYRLEGPAPILKCRIASDGAEKEIDLNWRVERWSSISPGIAPFTREIERPIAARKLANGAYWLSLGNFGDEGPLEAVAASLRGELETLRRAPYIVLDLRGNRGGNSGWGETFADIIYGEGAVDSQVARREAGLPRRHGKFWRATPAAAAEARKVSERFEEMGPDMAGPAKYFSDIAGLIENAPDGDRALVKDPWSTPDPFGSPPPPVVAPAYARPVFLLTDAACFSSCVLALGPLRAMGAIVVGETTGQNEEYGEIAGPLTTPSGLGRYFIPITIIRQRRDTLVVPAERLWPGAMDDDAGIAAWIENLSMEGPATERTDPR